MAKLSRRGLFLIIGAAAISRGYPTRPVSFSATLRVEFAKLLKEIRAFTLILHKKLPRESQSASWRS